MGINTNISYKTYNNSFTFLLLSNAIFSILHLINDNIEYNAQILFRVGNIICNFMMSLFLFNKGKNYSKKKFNFLLKPYWMGMIICNILICKLAILSNHSVTPFYILYSIGIIITIISLFNLNNSFSIVPESYQIKTNGMYSYVRHPMYLGESTMILAIMITNFTFASLLFFSLYCFFTIMRIKEEEILLSQNDTYLKYIKKTPYHLLPLIW